MAEKYLNLQTGIPTERTSIATSAGAGDSGKIPCLDANGRIAANMMPSGIVPEVVSATAAGAIAQYDLVNLFDGGGGVLKARKADGGTNKYEAHGFAPTAIADTVAGEIQMEGFIVGVALTIGAPYYVSETPGLFTATPVTGAGKMLQRCGYASTTTSLQFVPMPGITLLA